MGLFDRSSSRTEVTNEYNTETNTQQTDQGGNSGLNFSNLGGGVSLQSTTNVSTLDGGALNVAGNIASGAYGLGSQALGLGGKSLDAISQVNADSLSLLGGLVSGAIDNSRTMARDAIQAGSNTVSSAIAGFKSLAEQNSASSDDRVQKVAIYALLALAAAFVLPSLFKGGGKVNLT